MVQLWTLDLVDAVLSKVACDILVLESSVLSWTLTSIPLSSGPASGFPETPSLGTV